MAWPVSFRDNFDALVAPCPDDPGAFDHHNKRGPFREVYDVIRTLTSTLHESRVA